jgi:hypothetical protein
MTHALRLVAIAPLAACWSGGETAVAPAPPTATAVAAKPIRHARRIRPAPPPQLTAADQAAQLAAELRQQGPTALPGYLAGPVVVLDIDTGTISTLCDTAATAEAQNWGQLLVDPHRPELHCNPGATGATGLTVSCWQTDYRGPLIAVDLENQNGWRVISVMIGTLSHASTSTFRGAHQQFQAQIKTASCP